MKKKIQLIVTLAIMGHISAIFMYLLICFICTSYFSQPHSYIISQPEDQIEKIEICEYDYETSALTSLKVLDKREQKSILSDIPRLTSQKRFGAKVTSIGKIVVCISYKDGSAEILGTSNVAKIEATGKWRLSSTYFERIGFSKMLLKYVEEDLVPEKYREWAAQELPE